jgi:hypothetical protein
LDLEDRMKISLFIKSWKRDLQWLRYCLRFLEKNWKEPDTEVVVLLDTDCYGAIERTKYNLRLFIQYMEPWPDGYSHAMYVKACSDYWCDGELIVLLDSDTMLYEPADATCFLEDNKLIIPYLTWEEHLTKYPHSPWQRVREKVMGTQDTDQPWHYMAQAPIAYWSETFEGLRCLVRTRFGVEKFGDALYSDTPFSPHNFSHHPISFCDYDCLGLQAARYQPEKYIFRHLSQMPANPFCQKHSWTGWDDAKTELDRRLHGHLLSSSLSD